MNFIVTFIKGIGSLVTSGGLNRVIGVLSDLAALAKSAWAEYKKRKQDEWLEKRRSLRRQMREAKTDEERARLLREYNSL